FVRNPAVVRSRCRQCDQPRYHTTAKAITTIAFAIPAPSISVSKFGGAHGFTVAATTNVIAAVSRSVTIIAQHTGDIMMVRTTVSGALANRQLAATMFDDTRNVNQSMYTSAMVLAQAPPSIETAH